MTKPRPLRTESAMFMTCLNVTFKFRHPLVPSIRCHLEMSISISSPYPRETIKAVPTNQRVLPLSFSLSMKTGCGKFPVLSFGEIRVTEIFFGEISFVKFSVGEVSVVEGNISDAEAPHPWCTDAEFVPKFLVTEVERSVFEFGRTSGKSRK